MAKKVDWVKRIGIGVFLIVAVVSFLYGNFDLFEEEIPNEIDTADTSVHFIDCGQGDSILMISEGETALIDTGTQEESEKVVAYLKRKGLEKLDHLILSHPHADHMGGAKVILESFEVDQIHMGRPTEGAEPTTAFYINFLKKVQALGKKIDAAKAGDEMEIGAFSVKVLGPVEPYREMNNQSLVLRLEYGEVSFILTGDQEKDAEKDLLERVGLSDLDATVLKIGHHGSESSTSAAFLKAVSPQYAIISCGKDNSYGHPDEEIIERLNQNHIKYWRTDQSGSVVMATDGKGLRIESEK
ncbi:MAG: MBL fold metallo-hydrolase [Clostridia bacterium]|nr:MBL fold metallo-hydrolase [Clostridia bacterium]